MFISFPEIHVPIQGMDQVRLPSMIPIRQIYDSASIADLTGHIAWKMEEIIPDNRNLSGRRIAVTVGSRGIPHLAEMVKQICVTLRVWGAFPFIVPTMGSHGGASAEGQTGVLASYGITEEAMGVPLLSSMETVQYGELEGIPLYCDKLAFESDGVVVFNKVKPHTEFRGDHESGLAKMIAIGMGNHKGASSFHSLGFERFAEMIPKVAETFLGTGKVIMAIGVVQNAYDDISDIRVCVPEELLKTDEELLRIAKEKMARFKFDNIDLLIVDEIGKNISGTGCDPNVVGRNLSNTFSGILNLKKLFIRGLTPESHHSGVGLGMADMTTRACLNDVDWEASWANVMTTGSLIGGRIPIYANNDEDAIRQCLCTARCTDPSTTRIVRIKNTLSLEEIQVSTAIYEGLQGNPEIEQLGEAVPMLFSEGGNLL